MIFVKQSLKTTAVCKGSVYFRKMWSWSLIATHLILKHLCPSWTSWTGGWFGDWRGLEAVERHIEIGIIPKATLSGLGVQKWISTHVPLRLKSNYWQREQSLDLPLYARGAQWWPKHRALVKNQSSDTMQTCQSHSWANCTCESQRYTLQTLVI